MQKRTNKLLAILFVVSLLISIILFFLWSEVIPAGLPSDAVQMCSLFFPVVPFLFLQLLICKVAQRKLIKAIPILAIAIVAAGCAIGFSTASGWDSLGYIFILILCIAPAVGCIIGFVVNCFWSKQNYSVSAKTYVAIAVFPLLVISLGLFEVWYSYQGARTIYDIPAKEAVVNSFDKNIYTSDANDLIGYDRDQLHAMWGEPQGMLSGFWGDIWSVSNNTNVIVYYDAGGKIEYVKLDREDAYEDNQAAVTINGEIYYIVGEPIPVEVDASAFLGHAMPYLEDIPEAGYYDPDLEMPYAEIENGTVVLFMNEWYLCVPKK